MFTFSLCLVCILGSEAIVPYVLGYLLAIHTLIVVGVITLRLAYMVVPLRIASRAACDLAASYSSAQSSDYYYFCKN